MENKDKEGTEEGDKCNIDGCDGILEFPKVENCYCHISPPCSNCVENKLEYNKCFRIIE